MSSQNYKQIGQQASKWIWAVAHRVVNCAYRHTVVCFVRCLPFTYPTRLPSSDRSEIESLIALTTALAVNIVAAMFLEQEKGTRMFHLTIYTVLGILVIWAMMFIVSRTEKVGGRKMYYYDRLTVQIGKLLVVLGLASFAFFVHRGFAGNLPGQQQIPLIVNDTRYTNFVDGLPLLRLKVVAQPRHFGGRVPHDAEISLSVSDEISKLWKLKQASWSIPAETSLLREDGVENHVLNEADVPEREKDATKVPPVATFESLHDSDATYVFNFDFALANETEAVEMEKAWKDATTNEQRDGLKRAWREKYLTAYETAMDEIKKGGIKLDYVEPFWFGGDN